MIQIHTLKSEATDGPSYSCEKVIVGMGKQNKTNHFMQKYLYLQNTCYCY